jgi:hypothetical protein
MKPCSAMVQAHSFYGALLGTVLDYDHKLVHLSLQARQGELAGRGAEVGGATDGR